jgi:hypothetical protein
LTVIIYGPVIINRRNIAEKETVTPKKLVRPIVFHIDKLKKIRIVFLFQNIRSRFKFRLGEKFSMENMIMLL